MDTINGLFFAGQAMIRSADEPSYVRNPEFDSKDEHEAVFPAAHPYVFVRYSGQSTVDILANQSLHPTGSGGVVVAYQKLTRDKHTPAEVNAWRNGFEPEMLPDMDEIMCESESELDKALDDIADGAPFVILDADEPELNVPVQVEDIIRKLEEVDSINGTNLAEQARKSDATARSLWDAFKSLG